MTEQRNTLKSEYDKWGHNRRRYQLEKGLWDAIVIRFDHEDGAALRAFAKEKNVSLAEAGRTLLMLGLEKHKQLIER